MLIKDLPVGTKYKQTPDPRFNCNTEATFIVVSLESWVDVIGAPHIEQGASYCFDTNTLIPWCGHQNYEAIVVE